MHSALRISQLSMLRPRYLLMPTPLPDVSPGKGSVGFLLLPII